MAKPVVQIVRYFEQGKIGFKAQAEGQFLVSTLFENTKVAREYCQSLGYTCFKYPDGKFEKATFENPGNGYPTPFADPEM